MDDMQMKLDSILSDPGMMQKIMSLAQSIGQPKEEPPRQQHTDLPAIDPAMLQKMAGFLQRSGVDSNQQALLHALTPYLSSERIARLERAMRAAKLASFATTMLGSGALFSAGR